MRTVPELAQLGTRIPNLWRRSLACGLLLAILFMAGCARFQDRPISAAENAERLEGRSLTNTALKLFLEQNLHRQLQPWPAEMWDFEMLALAGLYWQPSLEVARAQWAVTKGGVTTAAQRPNPALNVTPGYDATTATPSPWIPLAFLDIPIETAGKRGYRMAQAAELSEAARLRLAAAAWQVRSSVRSNLVDLMAAQQREELLKRQLTTQEEIVKLLEQQVQAGAISSAESVPFRIALVKSRVDLADAQRLRADARARLAESLGVPVRTLDRVKLVFNLAQEMGAAEHLTSVDARRAALRSRADVLGTLAEYAASQSALQLEIARQYPDVRVAPGYQFDQGDSKWTLGITVDLPVFHQNQGPIAEARARREEVAARFNALQAKVLADIDRAVEVFHLNATNSTLLRSLIDVQARRRDAVEAQFRAGAVERLEVLSAQAELDAAEVAQLDAQLRLQQAVGALEDAVQRPFASSDAWEKEPRSAGLAGAGRDDELGPAGRKKADGRTN